MHQSRILADLFEPLPAQWGLRGDPYPWRDMRATFEGTPYPHTDVQLVTLLEATYQQLTGVPLSRPEPVFVERYSHGGMSSGYISPQFWLDTAIPLLRARYRGGR